MTGCMCEFPGDLTSIDHRRHHREWERTVQGQGTVFTEATSVEVTDLMIRVDQLIAHAHGGPLPELTLGAQGWLAQAAMTKGQRR